MEQCCVIDKKNYNMLIDAGQNRVILPRKSIFLVPTSGKENISPTFIGALKKDQLILTIHASLSLDGRVILKILQAESNPNEIKKNLDNSSVSKAIGMVVGFAKALAKLFVNDIIQGTTSSELTTTIDIALRKFETLKFYYTAVEVVV
ncbi:hypothetical protein DITRI_Ditri16bG0092100 [Diplodiscus trichospermus]